MAANNKPKTQKKTDKPIINQSLVYRKENYILLIISVLVLIIGFVVMGSGKDKPFDDPMKITVAPVLVLLGFAIGVVSILYTPKKAENKEVSE